MKQDSFAYQFNIFCLYLGVIYWNYLLVFHSTVEQLLHLLQHDSLHFHGTPLHEAHFILDKQDPNSVIRSLMHKVLWVIHPTRPGRRFFPKLAQSFPKGKLLVLYLFFALFYSYKIMQYYNISWMSAIKLLKQRSFKLCTGRIHNLSYL